MKLMIILLSICLQATSYVHCEEKIAALILARGGSKGISLKNLQNVGYNSLLARAINTAKSAGLHDVTVSTDHFLIALESIKNGAKLLHRSHITAVDWAPSIWGVSEFYASRPDVSILVLIQATSPFTRYTSLREAVRKIQGPVPYDCVFSVTKTYKLRWQYYNNSQIKPLNFQLDARPRRQDWDGELLETGSFYLARKYLIHEGVLQNKNCSVIEVSALESFEVDTYDDLRIANTLYTLEAIFTNKHKNMSNTAITYEDLEATDVISVELVPERKGLILKHCEYYVSSRRHGTTVTRRYNEFAQLYDVLFAKYPYRSVCRLPPKRVVVGGGSPRFLQRRRAALQRWLTLVARHPVLAHDADLRSFLCEISLKLDKPKHDEFTLAGTQEISRADTMSIEDMKSVFVCEQEQLRLMHLGLGRLCQIFEKVEARSEAERADIRELGAGFSALVQAAATATTAGSAAPRWASVSCALRAAADLASETSDSPAEELDVGEVSLALDALSAHRELCARLTRGLHGERAAAAAAAPHSPAAQLLRDRHRYALRCSLEEAQLARAYALMALESLPSLLRAHSATHARSAALWAALHAATRQPRTAAH